jgi:hypothetical protein
VPCRLLCGSKLQGLLLSGTLPSRSCAEPHRVPICTVFPMLLYRSVLFSHFCPKSWSNIKERNSNLGGRAMFLMDDVDKWWQPLLHGESFVLFLVWSIFVVHCRKGYRRLPLKLVYNETMALEQLPVQSQDESLCYESAAASQPPHNNQLKKNNKSF